MGLGLGTSLSKGGLATPGIVTDSLVLKHNYASGGVSLVSEGAALFDGTDDYITIADAANLSFVDGSGDDTAFSISAWINANDATNFNVLFKDTEYQFYLNASDKLTLLLEDETGGAGLEYSYSTQTIGENSWTHVACTYNGVGGTSASGGIKLYIDGVSVALTATGSGTYVDMENSSNAVTIGKSGSAYADGHICNVGLWSAVLTEAQIKSIMWKNYAGLASTETTNLVSWWNLSANANDDHGSNNGTLS